MGMVGVVESLMLVVDSNLLDGIVDCGGIVVCFMVLWLLLPLFGNGQVTLLQCTSSF